LSTGKQHPRIHEETLSVIELPLLTLEEQDSLIAKLDEILSRSFVLLREASGITDSIDPVFEKYFGLSLDVIKTAPGDRSIRLPLKEIAESRDARFSYKYHAPSVIRARKRLRSLSRYRLRDLLKEPAVLGDGVSPDEYAKDTGMYYLSMVGLKRWRLERDGLNQVTADYFDSHEAKHVQEGDVLMARAGEGTIGKIALVDQPIRAVCSDFVIRMRPDQSKLRPDFLRYCLTTSYYQHLVYGDKKGLGNNTNIFPNQVHEFPILEASLKLQETVCGELNAAAERAAVNLDTAKRLRDEIEETLNAALSA
jgi:type I restriction enzyme S subunit